MSLNTGAAEAILSNVGLLARKLRQVQIEGDLTLAERAAMSRLAHAGPATSAELARAEQISPQSMGVTLSALERQGLIGRDSDPHDGRRVVFSFTEAGLQWLKDSSNARAEVLAAVLADRFTSTEIELLVLVAPLLERLALSIPS
jgi:DNA-binding MarR family transcriptional regulator